MKKLFLFILLIQFSNCKFDNTKKKKSITEKKVIKPNELDKNIKYVIAKSGLNYRASPKGKIKGKFKFGKKLKIVKNTAIFHNVVDENKQIKGEWLGVVTEDNIDTTYVFDGFLANKKDLEIIGSNFLNLIPSGYEVEHKAVGDLNGDNLNDIAVVVKRKENFKGDRNIIVLLKDNTIFRIDKISKTAFPPKYYSEYNERYENEYDIENITIVNNELTIELYGAGVYGNNVSKFKYFGKKLLLSAIEVYANGAGENYQSNYDVVNGKIVTTTTNLLTENISTETKTRYVEKKEYEFENTNPRNINF